MDLDGELDVTHVLEKEILDRVYQEVSPCVVAILLDHVSTGFILKSNSTHNIIALENSLLGYKPDKSKITIRYYDSMTGIVDHIERLGGGISALYSPHQGNPRQAVKFGELQDTKCQKIFTIFPYKNDLMLYEGQITSTDCTSQSRRTGQIVPGGEKLFMCTCPVSACYDIDVKVNHVERQNCLRLILGAPVFSLDGIVIGRIYGTGISHYTKFATKSSAFRADLNKMEPLDWQDEKEKEKKHKANDASSSEEEGEPTPTVRKAKKERTDTKKERTDTKKGKTEAEEEVNDGRKRMATCQDDPADPNALASFKISEPLKQKLKSNGINALFPIQDITFRLIMDGNDLVGHARPGQEKTVAFVIPVLESLCNGPHKATRRTDYGRPPSVFVLLPTKELANQVHADFKFYGGAFGLSTCCAYEGSHYYPQWITMRKGVDVVVGTPGCVKDFIVKGSLSLKCLKFCVLDEADEMLNMGFADDVELILGKVEDVTEVQTLLFSATLSEWVKKLSMRFLKPEQRTFYLVGNEKMKASASVRHLALPCNHDARAQIIPGIIRCYSHGGRTIIFTKTKKSASELSSIIPGSRALHGDISQVEREVVVAEFRKGKFLVLVATNVAAQGLDISDVYLIIECEPPRDVPSAEVQDCLQGAVNAVGVTFDEVKELPALQERERQSWGGGGERGDRQGGERFG